MRSVSKSAADRPIAGIEIEVNPACIQLAGKPDPQTGLEGKFSTAYCAALGLRGYPVSDQDFTPERVADATLRDTLARVTLIPAPDRHMTSARIRLTFADGQALDAETALARGNPGNPMNWDDMRAKFMPLVTPVLDERGAELYDLLRNFGDGDAMDAIQEIVAR
jgi:2-methylcitrate dehydratase PrpD